jgi:hypothetical protein
MPDKPINGNRRVAACAFPFVTAYYDYDGSYRVGYGGRIHLVSNDPNDPADYSLVVTCAFR